MKSRWIRWLKITLLVVLNIATAQSQWSTDPSVNTIVHAQVYRDLGPPTICSDDSGGAIITYAAKDLYTNQWGVYSQRLSQEGIRLWNPLNIGGGIRLYQGNQPHNPISIDDGLGGSIIAWRDFRSDTLGGQSNINLFIQKINRDGTFLWGMNGVQISTAAYFGVRDNMISDMNHGAIIAWFGQGEDSTGVQTAVFSQRVNASGDLIWGVNGLVVSDSGRSPKIVSDSLGGCIVAWMGPSTILTQRLDSSGNTLWPDPGVPICPPSNAGDPIQMVNVGSSGSLIAWLRYDYPQYSLYVQRVNHDGIIQWSEDRTLIAERIVDHGAVRMVADGEGGAFIIFAKWIDNQSEIFIQQLDSNGNKKWDGDGVPVSDRPEKYLGDVTLHSNGGMIITWMDDYNGRDIWAQHMDENGDPRWTSSGVQITSRWGEAPQVVLGKYSSAILTWYSPVPSASQQIVAQVVNCDGAFGNSSIPTQISPIGGAMNQPLDVQLSWDVACGSETEVEVSHDSTFSSANEVDTTSESSSMILDSLSFDGSYYWRIRTRNNFGVSDWSEVLSFQTVTPAEHYIPVSRRWNIVSIPARTEGGKTDLFPTSVTPAYQFGSTGYFPDDTLDLGVGYWVKFEYHQLVPIHGDSVQIDSIEVVQGWNLIGSISSVVSVNEIESVPPGLTVSPFFEYHGGYSTSPTLSPGEGYWVKSDADGLLVLNNQSIMGSKAARLHISSETEMPPPPPGPVSMEEENGDSWLIEEKYFGLHQNYPNPFNSSTRIRYKLAEPNHVRLMVFNIIGQEVQELVNRYETDGEHEVDFDSSELRSGVYYYVIRVGEYASMKKMIIIN